MKFRELILIIAASIAAGYYLHEPLPDHGSSEAASINQLATTPVDLLQRDANAHKDMYGLTGETDGEPIDTFGEKRKQKNP